MVRVPRYHCDTKDGQDLTRDYVTSFMLFVFDMLGLE